MSDATSYTLVYESNTADKPSAQEYMNLLEKGRDDVKVETMRRILVAMLNGDTMPQLLMHIIRFVMPSRDKELKKLLHFYWEICPKLGPDGKLKQEMILVCNAIRNDLQHPNEYIRGATLRFLCKLREPDLLEPLMPSVRACLEHRHAYVRKNAVFTIYSVAAHCEPHLVPDAVDLIKIFLENETDATCKRNAFVALGNLSRDDAFEYLQRNYQQLANLDELLQLAFIEFIRRDAVHHVDLKPSYLKIMFEILESSPSNTVLFDAASALTSLTSNTSAVQAAASKFIDIAVKESDNNIKLIVLEIVDTLRQKNPGVLNDLTMDVLLILSSQDLDVRKKALALALSMVTSKNVDSVVRLFKKELSHTVNHDFDANAEYRQILIQAIHSCAIKFSEVAASVVDLLLDFIGDFNSNSAIDVIAFVKEVVELFPDLRASMVKRLIETLKDVRSGTVYRGALWILGEYCLDEKDIHDAWVHIRQSLGEIPILSSERAKLSSGDVEPEADGGAAHKPTAPKVLADGTYATESSFTVDPKSIEKVKSSRPPLRALILEGNYFVAAVLATTLTKLILRFKSLSKSVAHKNALRAEALLILTSILRVGESELVSERIDEDSADRIYLCLQAIAEDSPQVDLAFLQDSRDAFRTLIQKRKKKQDEQAASERAKTATQVDSPVKFRQFSKMDGGEAVDEVDEDLRNASNAGAADNADQITSRLKRIVQLTGFSDPVYAEAYVIVHQFDIVLDVLLFNQTTETLQNLSVEFATLGDLKVVERPSTQNIGPQSFHSIQTTIKVSSADAGVIFGNIVYEGHTASVNNVVILNDVHVDIMDYIKPGHSNETDFRTMWSEFEWENKVLISSKKFASLQGLLQYVLKNTNMTCLTEGVLKEPIGETADGVALYEDDCQFLSANLHARSSFGEDVLANMSVEKDADGKVSGHFRIRSKSQGLALSLGDHVAAIGRRDPAVQ